MKKTINEMFEEFRQECVLLAMKEGQWAAHLSGSKNKRTKFEKLIERYKKDIDIDIELGILDEDQKVRRLKIYEVMKKSMEFFKEYGKF